jgi:alkylation response protein AidB-like acyl-CoA dehydrogenase
MSEVSTLEWRNALARLGPVFAARASSYDESDRFVDENYRDLRAERILAALIPIELGGGGISYTEACELVRTVGHYCGSTALALSMHMHLIAVSVWNYIHGRPAEKLLRRAASEGLILVSTGAGDWLSSSGTLEPCEGGYRFTARKPFVSGCPAGDLMITSGCYKHPTQGRLVFHFTVPMSAPGISIATDWKAMGMRASGSHTVVLDNVFVPEEAVTLRRPSGEYHPGVNVNVPIVLPLISAVYVGVAEAMAASVRTEAARKGDDGLRSLLVGEIQNELTIAQLALASLVARVQDFAFEPSLSNTDAALIRKTLVAEAVTRLATKAMETSGGDGYFRTSGLERMARDLAAARFHTLQPKKQHRFSGLVAMGLQPIAD